MHGFGGRYTCETSAAVYGGAVGALAGHLSRAGLVVMPIWTEKPGAVVLLRQSDGFIGLGHLASLAEGAGNTCSNHPFIMGV